MHSLERHRGHFFNWYDTRTLAPLNPRYISTVDSGNLAGHLLTLRAGLASLADASILHPRWLDGVSDTFESCANRPPAPRVSCASRTARARHCRARRTAGSLCSHIEQLPRVRRSGRALPGAAADVPAPPGFAGPKFRTGPIRAWSKLTAGQTLERQCVALRDELIVLAPWLAVPKEAAQLHLLPIALKLSHWPRCSL